MNMALPFLNTDGLTQLEQNFEDLIHTLLHQCVKSDCTWQQLLRAFGFRPMHSEIEQYLQRSTLAEEQRRQILTCLLMNEC